jgi:hypothetical protein
MPDHAQQGIFRGGTTMFDFLKGGKATINLTLDRSDRIYSPGETIRAHLMVSGEKDLKVQQGRIALVYREEYQRRYETWHSDSHGHRHKSVEHSWETDELETGRQVFLGEGVIASGSRQTCDFEFTLPPDASPSCGEGSIIHVAWIVKATLDRKMAADVEACPEICVVSTAPGRYREAGEFGSSNEPGEAEMALRLRGKEYTLADAIRGELVVRPTKSFDISEARIELVRREYVPRDMGHEHLDVFRIKIAEGSKLQAGQQITWPFRIEIPGTGFGTMQTRNSSVTWSLRGVLARRLRGDTQVEDQVYVYNRASCG